MEASELAHLEATRPRRPGPGSHNSMFCSLTARNRPGRRVERGASLPRGASAPPTPGLPALAQQLCQQLPEKQSFFGHVAPRGIGAAGIDQPSEKAA